MQREALARALVITGLTVGTLIALLKQPDQSPTLGGALLVLVPAVVDAWAFFARVPSEGGR